MNQPAFLFGPTARKWALTFHLLSNRGDFGFLDLVLGQKLGDAA
jgi:hypothetical protein